MEKIAVYVDLDNIYSGVLDKLGIRKDDKLSIFKKELLKRTLARFVILMERKLLLTSSFENPQVNSEEDYVCLSFKTFAVYEKLPHVGGIFGTSFQSFLHALGAIPINPFVDFSKRSSSVKREKRKNASDIALILEAIDDIVVRKIPVNSIMICTGDSDLYPLVSWLKQCTGKKIIIAGFSGRVNKIYDYTPAVDKKVLLDAYFKTALNEVAKDMISNNSFKNFKKEDENFVRRLSLLNEDLKVSLINRIEQPESYDQEDSKCKKFEDKLLRALKNWLSKENYASTGIVMGSWFSRWNLDMDLEEANRCLERLILSGRLKEEGIRFLEEKRQGDQIIGKFYKED